MTATSSALSLCLFLTALGPCSEPQPLTSLLGADTPAPSAQPAPEPAIGHERPKPPTQTALALMLEHAQEADELRRGVIAGRFDQIHRASAVMASHVWVANLRADYLPHVTAVRHAVGAALEARSTPAAGAALGQLGAACAACHREHGGPPEPPNVELIADGVGAMATHAAAERALWEGLFIPYCIERKGCLRWRPELRSSGHVRRPDDPLPRQF